MTRRWPERSEILRQISTLFDFSIGGSFRKSGVEKLIEECGEKLRGEYVLKERKVSTEMGTGEVP